MAYFCKKVLYKSFLKSHKADILIWNEIRPQYHLYMKCKTYYWTVHHDIVQFLLLVNEMIIWILSNILYISLE